MQNSKKHNLLPAVNQPLLQQIQPEQIRVEVVPVKLVADGATQEGELDAAVELCGQQGKPRMVVVGN